jgi:hypothetical protein
LDRARLVILMRLTSVDVLRGLALTIVLLDHIDLSTKGVAFLRDWTLMGFGFSDAAEVFVFLSGFTFGWAYSERIVRDGFVSCQKRALGRTLQIYGGYLATVVIATSWEFALRNTSASMDPAVAIEDAAALRAALGNATWLAYQPVALGILCVYVIVLPFLPVILVLSRRCWWWAIGLSGCLYLLVQTNPRFTLPTQAGDWFFNPFAWQFLLVLGVVCGHRSRDGQMSAPHCGLCTLPAVLLVFYGAFTKKGVPLLHDHCADIRFWTLVESLQPPFVSKTQLAPLRLLHFLALAHLTSLVIPKNESSWRLRLAKPFVACGRHSLPVYCAGTLMAYLCVPVFRLAGVTSLSVLVIGLDACLLQFAFAALLDHRRKRGAGAAADGLLSGAAVNGCFKTDHRGAHQIRHRDNCSCAVCDALLTADSGGSHDTVRRRGPLFHDPDRAPPFRPG